MRLNDVGVRYRRRAPWVLREVSVSLGAGELIEVTGRNGSGKSTLLAVLAGVLRPGTGNVSGRPPVTALAPERFPSAQPFTVTGYLTHVARMYGVPGAPGRIGELAERLHLGHLLPIGLRDLSKGSAQKVGLAAALLPRPGLLLLDEPFSGLDAQTRAELPLLIGEELARGATVVFSDHQAHLRDHAPITHWRVANATVTPTTPAQPAGPAEATARAGTAAPAMPAGATAPVEAGADGATARAEGTGAAGAAIGAARALADAPSGAEPTSTVLEVTVDTAAAPALAARLRAEGHHVRPVPTTQDLPEAAS